MYLPVFVSVSVQQKKNPHSQKLCPAERKCHGIKLIPSQLNTTAKIWVIYRYLQFFLTQTRLSTFTLKKKKSEALTFINITRTFASFYPKKKIQILDKLINLNSMYRLEQELHTAKRNKWYFAQRRN